MFEAYKVGVKISLINEVSQGLFLISRHMQQTGQQAEALKRQINSIKLLGLAGAAIGGLGFMGLGIIGKMVKPATEYAHQLAQMNIAGMKHLEIVRATQAAWDASKTVPTTTAASNLAAIRELRMVFGDTGHAIEFMPIVQKMESVLSVMRGSGAHDEAYTVAKALELKGAVATPAQFTAQADAMVKAMVASGGKVGAADFLSAFKYGRTATSGWNDSFAYTILPTLIQEMKSAGGSGGSGGPGNALMSAFSAVVGGTVPQKALKVWQQLGLLDPSKVVWSKVGTSKGLKPGAIAGSEEFQANPFEWTQKFLVPALKKAGYTTEAQQRQMLQYLFPNRTAGFVMSQMTTQAWKFQRDQALIHGASGIGAYDALMKTDPNMAKLALAQQWQNLLAILGYQIMPPLIAGMLKLTDLLRDLSLWAKEHGTLTRGLMFAFTGLSAAMAFGGTITVMAAAFKGIGLAIGLMGTTAQLAGVATGLGSLATGIGLLGAALTGGMIGKLINWAYNKATGGSIGGDLASLFQPSVTSSTVVGGSGSPFVSSGGGAATGRNVGHVYLDGRKVGEHVARSISDSAGVAQAGITRNDMNMSLAPAGSN